jgi:hypothetical protein
MVTSLGNPKVTSSKPRGRPRERIAGQRIGPIVDARLLRKFDEVAGKEGLSRNKALEEAMRAYVRIRAQPPSLRQSVE